MKKFAKIISSPNMKLAAIRNKEVLPEYQYQSVVVDDDIKDYGKGKHYFIRTYGCQGNLRDSEVIAGILEKLGYEVTENYEIEVPHQVYICDYLLNNRSHLS